MLLSLLVYCVQAAGDSAVHVRVWCEPRAAAAAAGAAGACTHRLVLQVEARGRVLSPEQLSAVFDPYTACSHDTQHDAVRSAGRYSYAAGRDTNDAGACSP